MEVLICVLISILSIPFSHLLIFLARIVLRLATPIIQLHARAHFAWPTGPRFLGDLLLLLSGHTATSWDLLQVPPPWDINLSVAQYKCPLDRPISEAVDCVFCLFNIEEGEEIRELRCNHLFHRRCLDRWLAHRRRATCPLCRDALVLREPATTMNGDGDEEEELGDSAMALLFAYVGRWIYVVSSLFHRQRLFLGAL